MKYLLEEFNAMNESTMVCPQCGSDNVSLWNSPGYSSVGAGDYKCLSCGYMQSESEFMPLSRIPLPSMNENFQPGDKVRVTPDPYSGDYTQRKFTVVDMKSKDNNYWYKLDKRANPAWGLEDRDGFIHGRYLDEGFDLEYGSDPSQIDIKRKSHEEIKALMNKKMEPSEKTMMKWANDGYSRTVDGCKTEMDGWCPHGYPSWMLVLGII